MRKYVVSKAAQSDMRGIVRYTVEKWGPEQARRYVSGLQSTFEMLVQNPEAGRTCDVIRDGLRRHETEKHVIFYRQIPAGIRIVRVLHQQMLPQPPRFEL